MESVPLKTAALQASARSSSYITAYTCAVIAAMCAGSVMLFSLYIPTLQLSLGFNLTQINVISIASLLGTYLTVPLLGYWGDKYGPKILGIVGAIFLPGGYLAAACCVAAKLKSPYYLAACFAGMGIGTSSLFFCAVLICTRLYPDSTLLSLSLPTAAYGSSSLWQSLVVSRLFAVPGDNAKGSQLNLNAVYLSYAVLFIIVGLIGAFGGDLAKKIKEAKPVIDVEGYQAITESEQPSQETSDTDFNARLLTFLRDKTTWVFFLAFVITAGPLEMYQNNMGAIMDTIPDGPNAAVQLSIFALCSTAARLSIGVVSDKIRPWVSRPTLYAMVLIATAALHIMLAQGVLSRDKGSFFYLSSVANGISYGTAFTLTPIIVGAVWGLESFGTNWGSYVLAPAIGSILFGLLFGRVYDSFNDKGPQATAYICDRGFHCYERTFYVSGACMLVSAMLIYGTWRVQWRFYVKNL